MRQPTLPMDLPEAQWFDLAERQPEEGDVVQVRLTDGRVLVASRHEDGQPGATWWSAPYLGDGTVSLDGGESFFDDEVEAWRPWRLMGSRVRFNEAPGQEARPGDIVFGPFDLHTGDWDPPPIEVVHGNAEDDDA